MSLFHGRQNSSFNDGRQSFRTSWYVFLFDSNVFRKEIFSLDKFWFCGSTHNTFKPLVWHLLHQNIFSINDFMNVYEKLIIFIKSLIFNIFWWKTCQTIGLKVFWVDLQNQNLSKINISCPKIFELAKHKWKSEVKTSKIDLGFYDGAIKSSCFLSCFLWFCMSDSNMSPIIKTTILFPMKQTHICIQYLKMMQLRPEFYNAWNLRWNMSAARNCRCGLGPP